MSFFQFGFFMSFFGAAEVLCWHLKQDRPKHIRRKEDSIWNNYLRDKTKILLNEGQLDGKTENQIEELVCKGFHDRASCTKHFLTNFDLYIKEAKGTLDYF